MNKYFDDEIAAMLNESKEDPIVILANRLQNYIDTANSPINRMMRKIYSAHYNQIDTCKRLKPNLLVIFNHNKISMCDKIEKLTVDPETIDTNDHFAAILGAFITIFPEYTQHIPLEIRDRLPKATNWLQQCGIKKEWDNVTNQMNSLGDFLATLFPILPEDMQYATLDSNILNELKHSDETDYFLKSCETIKTIFQHLDGDKSTKVIDELLRAIEKYQAPDAIKTLTEIYPYIETQAHQSKIMLWLSKALTKNLPDSQPALLSAAATIYPHITGKEHQNLIFNIIRNKLEKNSPEAVNAIKVISPHLTRGYAGLSSDFIQLINNFSHARYSIRDASTKACASLYKHMEAKDEASLNTFFDKLLSVMRDKKDAQLNRPDIYLETACISLATAYPHFKTSSAAKQKENFLAALNSMSPKFLPAQHQAFALIYPYIEDSKAPRRESDSKSPEDQRSLIVTNLTTYISKIDQQVSTTNPEATFNAAASIFLSLNAQKDSDHHNRIFNAVNDSIKNNKQHYIAIACSTLTRMKPNFSNKQADELTQLMLARCENAESCEPEFRLLGGLIPFHQNTTRRMILNLLILKIGMTEYFPDVITSCSPLEQWIAAKYMASKVNRNTRDLNYTPRLFHSLWQIVKNKECKEYQEKTDKVIDKEIDTVLQHLPQTVTQLICSYRS